MKNCVAKWAKILPQRALALAIVMGWLLFPAARVDGQILEFFVRSMFGPSRPERPVVDLPPEVVDGQVNAYAAILRERVDVELCYLEDVCDLDGTARATLAAEGERLMANIRAELRRAIQHGGNADQGYIQIGGQLVEVPGGVEERIFAVDELLAEAAVKLAAGVRAKLAAEHTRLANRRQQTIAATLTAKLDESLLLSAQQRRDLCDLFARHVERNANSLDQFIYLLTDSTNWFLVSEIEELRLHDDALAAILTPDQLVGWHSLRQLGSRVEKRFAVAMFGGGAAAIELVDLPVVEQEVIEVEAVAPDDLALQEGIAGPQPADNDEAAIEVLEQKVVAQVESPADERKRLEALLRRSLDDVDHACDLSDEQRRKLMLAGQLDVMAALEKTADTRRALVEALARQAENEEAEVEDVIQFAVEDAPPPIGDFFGPSARFGKFLRSRLSEPQTRQLAQHRRDRAEFQRQAVIGTVECQLGDYARLTVAARASLAEVLRSELDGLPIGETMSPASDALRHLMNLPDAKLRALAQDKQWPAVSRRWFDLRAEVVSEDDGLLAIPAAP